MRLTMVPWIVVTSLVFACRMDTAVGTAPADSLSTVTSSDVPLHLAKTTYLVQDGSGKAGFSVVKNDMPQIYKDGFTMAANSAFYNEGLGNASELASTAGECYEIAGPDGTVTVMVIDGSPETPPAGASLFDLNETAFATIAPLPSGIVPTAFRWVPTPTTGNLKLYLDAGSSEYYLSVLIYNHAIGVAKVELSATGTGGQWVSLPRNEVNRFIWVGSSGPLGTDIRFRVTSRQGQTIEFDPIDTIGSGQTYVASAQFSNLGALESPPVWPGPPRTVYGDALGAEAGVGWYTTGAFRLTPAAPNYTDTTDPHGGDYCLFAGSFGDYGFIQIAYPFAFDRSAYTGIELWVRSDSSAAWSSLQVTVGDGASTSSPSTLSGVSSTWQRFRVSFADVAAPQKMVYLMVTNASSSSSPAIWLDDVRLY